MSACLCITHNYHPIDLPTIDYFNFISISISKTGKWMPCNCEVCKRRPIFYSGFSSLFLRSQKMNNLFHQIRFSFYLNNLWRSLCCFALHISFQLIYNLLHFYRIWSLILCISNSDLGWKSAQKLDRRSFNIGQRSKLIYLLFFSYLLFTVRFCGVLRILSNTNKKFDLCQF